MKKIYGILITFFLAFWVTPFSYAEEEVIITEDNTIEIISDTTDEERNRLISDLDFNKNLKVGETLRIDLSGIEKILMSNIDGEIEFEWSLKDNSTKNGSIFEQSFDTYGKQLINLNIYSKEEEEKTLITSKDITLFVYQSKTHIIIDGDIVKEKIDRYKDQSLNNGIYVEEIIRVTQKDLEKSNILHLINTKSLIDANEGNYITIWGNKNFLFSVLSQINTEIESTKSAETFNIVLMSPYSTDVIQNYLKNFLANKYWIDTILLLPESSESQIRLNPDNIISLENSLRTLGYEYININITSQISEILFISNFVNTLSNNGFTTQEILLVMIIPFLFTGISIMKHLIGLSAVGSIIPIMITLSLFLIGFIPTMALILSIIIINLILSKVTNKYTLLYTPKMSFILIINIIVAIVLINTLIQYNLMSSNITDILFIILFVIICERLITVVLSKEFGEYKFNLLNTIGFAILSYLLFSISFVQTLILAYPEVIILLVPINFIIGRFTGLRITEYFRFNEVIKSIEE